MDILIVYSSLTGNTKKVAKGIYEEFKENADIFSVEEVGDIEDYKYIFVGGWADKGKIDQKTQHFLKVLKNKRVGLFLTLGAYPYSIHAYSVIVDSTKLLDDSNTVLGAYICQGALSPEILKRFEHLPKDDPHYPSPGKQLRRQIAATHPDEEDIEKAKKVFRQMVERDIDG
ncbi:MAG: flavodoxin family protein [Tissierellia bacterium]|nr:flavodoxin family protein [Tissierellia bacterium]